MKKALIVILLVTLTACQSTKTLMEHGKYDKVIKRSVNHLSHKKLKTKWVLHLEAAYVEAFQILRDSISHLKIKNQEKNWDLIYDLYKEIEKYQLTVIPFLPLRSDDGYLAQLEIIDIAPLITEAANRASEFHYQEALTYLEAGRKGDKRAARHSYYEVEKIKKYSVDYKSMQMLQSEVFELGKIYVLLDFINDSSTDISGDFKFWAMNPQNLSTKWNKFHYQMPDGVLPDYEVTYMVNAVYVEEHISSSCWTETKEVEDGYIEKKTIVDSVEVIKKIPVYKTISATVTKKTFEKDASVHGKLMIYDARLNEEEGVSINGYADFDDEYISYSGDSEALTTSVGGFYPSFPSDYSLIGNAVDNAGWYISKILKRRIKP